ncbi:hypothetical protein ACFXPT_38840 [Streptomyces goshikiensis]|uniref:hypothetical protein n=1 Tax=Streptomyces goshikiensis TaxID=1942 RepID=UPI00367A685C
MPLAAHFHPHCHGEAAQKLVLILFCLSQERRYLMRILAKIATASAVIAPIMLLGAGVSVADSGPEYSKSEQQAGPSGASYCAIFSGIHEDRAYYYAVSSEAGPEGASSTEASSHS